MPAGARIAEDHGPTGRAARVCARGAIENIFDFFFRHVVFRNVLHIASGWLCALQFSGFSPIAFLLRHELLDGGEWRKAEPTDIDCAKRRAKPDQAGPRGSQNHATARDIEQLARRSRRRRASPGSCPTLALLRRASTSNRALTGFSPSFAHHLRTCSNPLPQPLPRFFLTSVNGWSWWATWLFRNLFTPSICLRTPGLRLAPSAFGSY